MSKSRPSPFSIRLNGAERAQLEQKAAGRPLGAFVKEVVLGDTPARRAQRAPVKDGVALARALGLLGKTRLANNLNQLAKSANMGALPVTPELETGLKEACADIRLMRTALLQALGVTVQDLPPPLADTFAHANGRAR